MPRSQQLPFENPPPPLSKTETDVLLDEAYESFDQLFTAVLIARNGSNGTHVGGISGATTDAVMMCTSTIIFGTLEAVAELYTDSDSHYILDFEQSKRIYELESPTRDHPMRCTGLRWSKWASISKLVTGRDILYLETMDEFVDKKTGRRGWARCTKSVEHRVCPESQHPNGPVRAELMVSGQVVRETEKFGVLELVTLVHCDVKNSIPSWITRAVLKARKRNALSLNHVLKVRRRVREGAGTSSGSGSSQIGDSTTKTHEDSDHQHVKKRICKGCEDSVSKWSRSYKCRKCTELICKHCAAMTYFDTDTHTLKNRICADCSLDGDDGGGDGDGGGGDTASFHERGHGRGDKKANKKQTKTQQQRATGQSEDGGVLNRPRLFSYVSVDQDSSRGGTTTTTTEQGNTTTTTNTTANMNEKPLDFGATMRRLRELNARNEAKKESQRKLCRQQSGGSKSSRTRHHHQRSQPQIGVSHASVHHSTTSGSSAAAAHASASAAALATRSGSGASRPASRKAPPPPPPPMVVDLSYLQLFATAKPTTMAT